MGASAEVGYLTSTSGQQQSDGAGGRMEERVRRQRHISSSCAVNSNWVRDINRTVPPLTSPSLSHRGMTA